MERGVIRLHHGKNREFWPFGKPPEAKAPKHCVSLKIYFIAGGPPDERIHS
jgi:hypothetical protein